MHELNIMLMDLVKFLAIGYKVAIRLLNPLAKLYMYKAGITEEGIRDTTKNLSKKWHKVKNGYKQNDSNEKNN